jgi:hypothetical protein
VSQRRAPEVRLWEVSHFPEPSGLETAMATLNDLDFQLLSTTVLMGFLERRFPYFLVPLRAE